MALVISTGRPSRATPPLIKQLLFLSVCVHYRTQQIKRKMRWLHSGNKNSIHLNHRLSLLQ